MKLKDILQGKSIATLTVAKIVVEETPIKFGNGDHQTIGQLIDGYISNEIAKCPTTMIQDISIQFEPEDWLAYCERHSDAAYPTTTTNSVPLTETEARLATHSLDDKAGRLATLAKTTTNKVLAKKAERVLHYVKFPQRATHEYCGPFLTNKDAMDWAQAYNNNKKENRESFVVVPDTVLSWSDTKNADKPAPDGHYNNDR